MHPSFWQTYKFMNPVTQKIEPKDMYCERLDQTVGVPAASTSSEARSRAEAWVSLALSPLES